MYLHQNTLQDVEEEVFLQINKLNEPSCLFFLSIFHQQNLIRRFISRSCAFS